MNAQLDSRFVIARHALPEYADMGDAAQAMTAHARAESCLGRLSKLIPRDTQPPVEVEMEGQVPVQEPPPPTVYGFATFFRHDPDVITTSRQALAEYREMYEEPADQPPYPLRVRQARHTGLPALLNGFLDDGETPASTLKDPEGAGRRWLFQDLRARALFGIEPAAAQARFRDIGTVQVKGGADRPFMISTLSQTKTIMHVRYQQWHQERWPVFGGQVIVHLTTGDRRAAVTSSYFPLAAETEFPGPYLDPSEAVALAQQVLMGYRVGPEAIGLFWNLLRPWLEAEPGSTPAREWRAWHSAVAERLVRVLADFSRTHEHDLAPLREMEALVETGLPGTRDELLALLRSVWDERQKYGLLEWDARVVPYEGGLLFILPFAGRYHLAYQIELLSPDADEAWRVFVDARSGEVLGWPENMLFHVAQLYLKSGDALAATSTPLSDAALQTLDQETETFMLLRRHPDTGAAGVLPLFPEDMSLPERIRSEAVNIAYHARELYNHFTATCGIAPATLQEYKYYDENGQERTQSPGLEILVGKEGTDLDMGFFNDHTRHPKLITFQTDGGAGLLAEGGKRVFTPSLDPDVIYHEMAHGLMWLFHRAPFDNQQASVPFGRALIEGYANYLARSLAARVDPEATDPDARLWARAAYRKDSNNGWGERWALARQTWESGADHLPAPNLYPYEAITGLPVYDVGMVWARALWEIRQQLGDDLADHLAVDAFNYVHGWVANFETAAEGLIDGALKANLPEAQIANVIDTFAKRGILAERGVQALAAVSPSGGNPMLLVGSDAGVKRYTGPNTPWQDWGLAGVVALADDGPIVYAATETGVYQRNVSSNVWSEVGRWPETETPLCMVVAGGIIYVGTSHGVWRYDQAQNQWRPWNPAVSPFEGIALKMTMANIKGTDDNQHQVCFVANVTSMGNMAVVTPGAANPDAWPNLGMIAPGARMTAIAVHRDAGQRDTLYAGTLSHGIWRRQDVTYDVGFGLSGPAWQKTSGNTLDGKAVLCLAVDNSGNRLLAGTTGGLWEQNLGGGSWSRIAGVPADAMVTVTLPAGNVLLVGTANQGVHVQDGGVWKQHNIGT